MNSHNLRYGRDELKNKKLDSPARCTGIAKVMDITRVMDFTASFTCRGGTGRLERALKARS